MTDSPYDDYDYDDLDDGPVEDDGLDECGMLADGQCTLAGSEWCDWDCPRGGMTLRQSSIDDGHEGRQAVVSPTIPQGGRDEA